MSFKLIHHNVFESSNVTTEAELDIVARENGFKRVHMVVVDQLTTKVVDSHDVYACFESLTPELDDWDYDERDFSIYNGWCLVVDPMDTYGMSTKEYGLKAGEVIHPRNFTLLVNANLHRHHGDSNRVYGYDKSTNTLTYGVRMRVDREDHHDLVCIGFVKQFDENGKLIVDYEVTDMEINHDGESYYDDVTLERIARLLDALCVHEDPETGCYWSRL